MSRPRPSLVILLLLTMLAWATADVSGPAPAGQPARHAPVLIAGKVEPSPQTSPGVVQNIAVDANGAVATTLYAGGAAIGNGNGINVQGGHAHDQSDGGNPVKVGGYAHATGSLPTAVSANGDRANLLVDRYGRTRSIVESPNGYAIGSDDGMLVAIGCSVNAVGAITFRSVALTNASQEVKAFAGNAYSVVLGNPNTNNAWCHLYNTANASVTVGTTTPLASYMVAANSTLVVPGPIAFSSACAIACTNAATGTQAPANNLTVDVHYK